MIIITTTVIIMIFIILIVFNNICYSPNGKTVPKILSTVRSLRPRAEIKTDKC